MGSVTEAGPGLFAPRTPQELATRLQLARRAHQNILNSADQESAALLRQFPLYAFYVTKGRPLRVTSVRAGPRPRLFGICSAGKNIRMLTCGIAITAVRAVDSWPQDALDKISQLGCAAGAPLDPVPFITLHHPPFLTLL